MSSEPPAIAVVVCTYNRAARLRLCLDSLAAQTYPAERTEIVVVDDGSTDVTPAVCQDRIGRLHGLRVIRQANSGLGAARNRGWKAAAAPVVAFIDDDAVAPNTQESACLIS